MENKRIVLLGAGASAPDSLHGSGVPTARMMTAEMLKLIVDEPTDIRHAIRLAVSALNFGAGIRGEDPTQGVNIEDVFNLLETLENRNSLEASPLIGSWNPVVEKLDQVVSKPRIRNSQSLMPTKTMEFGLRDTIKEIVDGITQAKTRDSSWHPGLERALLKFADKINSNDRDINSRPPEVAITRDIPGQGAIFKNSRDCLIRKLNDLVWIEDEKFVSRFAPLIGAARDEGFIVATLNYDNCVELAATKEQIEVNSGIPRWFEEDDGSSNDSGFRLLKLHGSIDWKLVKNEGVSAIGLNSFRIHRMNRDEMNEGIWDPALVFGGKNKLTARGPFLDLLMEFRSSLFKSEELVVVGYSFGDLHINALIEEWVAGNSGAKLQIVCGEDFSPDEGTLARRLLKLGAERVVDTKLKAKDGIKKIFDS